MDSIPCPKCGSDKTQKNGRKRGYQKIFCKICRKNSTIYPDKAPVPVVPQNPAGRILTLAQVIEKFDIPAAIRRELAQLPRGQLILEAELCQRTAGSDKQRFRRCVENNADAFRPYRIRLRIDEGDPRWYWGGQIDIEEAQRIVNA